MDNLVETLTSYIPSLVAYRLVQDPAPITEPAAERFSAAVLFADISGFTAITEQMGRSGPGGIENLSRLLNDYFGRLTELIFAHGGDVVKFAGDAMLAIWPAQERLAAAGAAPGLPDPDLAEATLRAAGCALQIQEALCDYTAGGQTLRMRVAVGAGELDAVYIGGVYQRWEFLLAGEPLVQVGQIESQIHPGGVILSPEAWELTGGQCRGIRQASGAVHLQSLGNPPPPRPAGQVRLPAEAEPALWAYVPGAIRARLAAGQSGWLAELRRLTVLFVNLPDLCHTTPLVEAQQIMDALQNCLYRYEGSINKISIDEKGVTLVAALGLPPLAHADDAGRGLRAARDIQAALRANRVHNAIGVASGPVFCGSIGSRRRREYAILGGTVNLAARLMQAALAHPRTMLLCDAATRQAAGEQFIFETLPPAAIKGRSEPVPVFQPLEEKPAALLSQGEMVGRTAERMQLADCCQALLGGQGRLLIIEGEAGIGKSRLAGDLLRQARSLGFNVLAGAGDAIERFSPYYAWRPVFARLFELDLFSDPPELQRSRVLGWLQALRPDLLELAPLLDAVLPLDLPDNELTAQLAGDGRANRTGELLVSLLQDQARAGRLLLVLEDAHWLDSASWALARRAWKEVQPLLLALAARPMAEPLPPGYARLRSEENPLHLHLEALPVDDIRALVCQRLGVASVPEPALRLIETRAEGHPFFSEELAYALRDSGLIQVAEGGCRLAPGAEDLAALDFPNSIQGVIISRIDRLTPQQQLTLKVASVIGRLFAFRVLRDIYPIEADRAGLPAALHTLEQLDLTPLDTPEPDLAYIFKHVITQEVTYNLMAYVQRRALHRVTAEWYEHTYAADLSPYYPLLAHHWTRVVAGQGESEPLLDDPALVAHAVDVLERAGDQARLDNANQEAINFFETLLGWLGRAGMPVVPALRQAHWERQLGQATYGLGDLQASRAHYERALSLLGWPMPATTGGLLLRFLAQAGVQTGHILRPPRPPAGADPRHAAMREAADACGLLGQIYYQLEDSLRTTIASLQAVNLGETAGGSQILPLSYAMTGIAASLVPIHPLARRYIHGGLASAQQAGGLFEIAFAAEGAGVYYLGTGQAASAGENLERAAVIFQRLGNRRHLDESRALWAWSCYLQGRLAQAIDLWKLATLSGNQAQDPWVQAWGLSGQVEVGLAAGLAPAEAGQLMAEARAVLERGVSLPEQIRVWGVSSKTHLLCGELELAGQAADRALDWIGRSIPTNVYTYEGYAFAAETSLALWERERSAACQARAKRALRQMWSFGRVFSMARARAWRLQGRYEWQAGHPKKALSAWRKSIAKASLRSLPCEEAWAHQDLAAHLPSDDPARQRHLEQAAALLLGK